MAKNGLKTNHREREPRDELHSSRGYRFERRVQVGCSPCIVVTSRAEL